MAQITPPLANCTENFPVSWGTLVMDVVEPGQGPCLRQFRAVLSRRPGTRVMVYAGQTHPCLARAIIETGARAYVAKTSSPQLVKDAILAVMAGRQFVDPAVDLDAAGRHPWYLLTTCEQGVMLALAQGVSLPVLAQASGRSYKTVSAHKYNALHKLNLRSRAEIGQYLAREGLSYLLS